MEVKKITAEEIKTYWESLSELLQICFVSTYGREKENEFIDSKLNGLTEYVKCGKAILIGAYCSENLVGFLWGYPVNTPFETILHAAYIAVKEDFRGRGAGQLLIKAFEQEAIKMNIAHIELIAGAENKNAIKFYDRGGYKADRIILRKRV